MLSARSLWITLILSSSSQKTPAHSSQVWISPLWFCAFRWSLTTEMPDRGDRQKSRGRNSSETKIAEAFFFVVFVVVLVAVACEDNDMACVAVRGQRRWGLSWGNMSVVYYCLWAQRIWGAGEGSPHCGLEKKKEHSRMHTAHLIRECIWTEDSPQTHKAPSNIACVVGYNIFCKIQDLQRTVNRVELPVGRKDILYCTIEFRGVLYRSLILNPCLDIWI